MDIFQKKTKEFFSGGIVFCMIFIFAGLFVPTKNVSACFVWAVEAPCDDIIGHIYNELYEKIQETIAGVLKNAAYQLIVVKMNKSLGSNGFVQDFFQDIFRKSSMRAYKTVDNMITHSFGGRTSIGYSPWSSSSESRSSQSCWVSPTTKQRFCPGSNGTYSAMVREGVRGAVSTRIAQSLPVFSANEHCKDPFRPFDQGNSRCFSSLLSEANNKLGVSLAVERTFSSFESQFSQATQAQNIAYRGFSPTMKNGAIVTPGSFTADLTVKAFGSVYDMLSGAKSWSELTSIAATDLINGLINDAINMGIGMARSYVDKQFKKVEDKINQKVNKAINGDSNVNGKSGPAAEYQRRY